MDGGKSDMEQRFNHLEQRIDRSSEETGKKFDMMATSVNKLADSVAELVKRDIRVDEGMKRIDERFARMETRMDKHGEQIGEIRDSRLREEQGRKWFTGAWPFLLVGCTAAGIVIPMFLKGI